MALTKATNRMIEGAYLNVKDFGAIGDAVADDTAAIQAALNEACVGTNVAPVGGGGYAAPLKTVYIPKGVYRLTSTLTVPTTNAGFIKILGEASVYHSPSLLQDHAGHVLVLGNSTQAGSPSIENIVIQGNKTTYSGLHHGIVQTTTGPAATSNQIFKNVLVRDMGGVGIYMDYAFYVQFDTVSVNYNKTGGMYIGGGGGSAFNILTQNNEGYGVDIGGTGHTIHLFLEGDCIDNDPAGLNLSNYVLKVRGGSNFIHGSISTNVNNNKTGVRIEGGNNVIGLALSDATLVDPKISFASSSNYNTINGNMGNSDAFFTGDADALATLKCQGDAGSVRLSSSGQLLFTAGNEASKPVVEGMHVGYDDGANIGYIHPTLPGTANYELKISGNPVLIAGNLATNQSQTTTSTGSIIKRLPVYDESNVLLGYMPIYDSL